MSTTFDAIRDLVSRDDWRASDHGLQRLTELGIIASDLTVRIEDGSPIEDYPEYHAGPCVLVLQTDRDGPVHVLWGLEAGTQRPAVLITAYRPDPALWQQDNRSRKP